MSHNKILEKLASALTSHIVVVVALVCSLSLKSVAGEKASTKTSGQRTFTGNGLQEIAFPIGGIGTGSISLGGRGDLRDWEIFNRPDKGSRLNFSFFAVWAKAKGRKPVTRILEREAIPPYRGGGFGLSQRELLGLPRLKEAEFSGEYPFAKIKFRDPALPVQAELEAWNPFIPLNVDDSALPLAYFVWTFRNPSFEPVDISVAASLFNPIGSRYTNTKNEIPGLGRNINQFVDENDIRGLLLSSQKVKSDDVNYGTMALATQWQDLDVQTRWYRGGWWDQCHVFWDDFSDDGRIKNIRDTLSSDDNTSDVGSLVLHATIPAYGRVSMPVLLTWYFPNRENYWNDENEVRGRLMRNYVATKFNNAWEVAAYFTHNRVRLEEETRSFHDALFSSTLPAEVLDALSTQMSTVKTNVCMLLEDGSFYGFEGNGDNAGCGAMNCTHVWNYEQAVAYLFPQLERNMRETDFLHNTLPNGYMTFRTLVPKGEYWWKFKACADGQMGAIVRAYREWKYSGDTEWLKKLWPKIKLALEFAWRGSGDPPRQGFEWTKELITMPWDPDKNGMMEGEQHNTYDIEFYGPNTMTGSLYLGALKAASRMADVLGEPGKSREYLELHEQGSKLYDDALWNGEYYEQDVYVLKGLKVPKHLIPPEETSRGAHGERKDAPSRKKPALDTVAGIAPKYQYGKGCLSDQLLGQYLSHVAGLGYVLDPRHVRTAMKSIFKYNYKKSMSEFANVQRVYALNNESGLLLCSWPKGDRPALPFVYSDEVWTGIEYQVAATLIYNGWINEGLQVVRGVCNRYDGYNRNPWDEVEYGHHYARAMASWSLLTALTGFQYDGFNQTMEFKPAISKEDFKTFWSCGSAWGSYAQKKQGNQVRALVEVKYGSVQLKSFSLGTGKSFKSVKVKLGDKSVAAHLMKENGKTVVRFDQPIESSRSGNATIEIILL